MKKYKVGRGILVVLVLCLLAAGGLSGYSYYKSRKPERELHKLIEEYDVVVKAYMEEYMAQMEKLNKDSAGSSVDDIEESMKESADEITDCNLKITQFQEKHKVTLDMWIDILMDEQFGDDTKSKLISNYIKNEPGYTQDLDSFYRLLDSEKVSDEVKDDVLAVLMPHTREQRQKLTGYSRDILEHITSDYDFLSKVRTMFQYSEEDLILPVMNYFLDPSNECSEAQKLGAAIAKSSYMDDTRIAGYSKEEKEVLSAILKDGYQKKSDESYSFLWLEMLKAVAKLRREEDISWLAEEAKELHNSPENGLGKYDNTSLYLDIMKAAFACVKENPSVDNLTYAIEIINCTLTRESYESGGEPILLYVKALIESCPEKEQLPVLAEGVK